MAQTDTSVFINLYVAGLLFWLPFCILSLLRAVSLLTLGMGWTLTCGYQAWPRGHECNPCTAHLLFWQPFFIPQQEELFFQGNEQTGWWSSSSHYIMFLRTSTLQREEKKCLFSRRILLGRQFLYWFILRLAVATSWQSLPQNLPVMGTVCVLLEKWPLWWDSLECPFS